MPKLFFAGTIGDRQHLQGDTLPSVRYLMREKEKRFGKGLQAFVGI